MKIFITGIAGFLGSHVADKLIAMGHTVLGCDNLSGGYMRNIPLKSEFYEIDIKNIAQHQQLLDGVDVVFHAAATAYDGLSFFAPHLITKNILSNSAALLSASINQKVKKFVFCSSMARYGKQDISLCHEDMTPSPISPYGIAKFAFERVLQNMSDVHGINYSICVPHNIIGPRQKYNDPYRNVAAIMIHRMMQGKQPVIYGDGQQMRCFSFVDDCVDPIYKIITDDNVKNDIFNIGPDEEFITIEGLAQTIAKILDFDLKPIYYNERPAEVKMANCSAEKARKLLGYSTSTNLYHGLEQMISWMKDVPNEKFDYNIDIEINNEKTPRTWTEKLI